MSKILIIEDELSIAELERDYLELNDFEVEIETNGINGLEKALSEEYSLILLDLMLPDMDGFEICRQIRYFCICHENIHGDIYFDSCQMGHPNGLGHFFFIQIMSKFTGIKSLSSQINRIGTRIDGSAYRIQ